GSCARRSTVSAVKSSNRTGPSRNVSEPTWSRWTGRSKYRNVASIGDNRALVAMASLLLLPQCGPQDHACPVEHRACHPMGTGAATRRSLRVLKDEKESDAFFSPAGVLGRARRVLPGGDGFHA